MFACVFVCVWCGVGVDVCVGVWRNPFFGGGCTAGAVALTRKRRELIDGNCNNTLDAWARIRYIQSCCSSVAALTRKRRELIDGNTLDAWARIRYTELLQRCCSSVAALLQLCCIQSCCSSVAALPVIRLMRVLALRYIELLQLCCSSVAALWQLHYAIVLDITCFRSVCYAC